MKRNYSRIRAMMILYNYDLLKNKDDTLVADLITNDSDDIQIDEEFSNSLISGVIENLAIIDNIIAINLTNYTIDRLSFVDRNIIRLAIYEMKFNKLSPRIVINEYLNISKEYSQIDNFNSVKFNNSLLDKIASKQGFKENE